MLRYDLGDSVLVRRDRCPCGNPLPAIHVQGRTAGVLTFSGAPAGQSVTITPLALSALLDRIAGIEVAQIVQTRPTELQIRCRPAPDADPEQVWQVLLS